MTGKVRNILLIGRTGNGKSTVANVLVGDNKFKESEFSVSETKEIQVEEFEDSITRDGTEKIKYRVIDTIGIGDTTLEPREVMGRIAKVAHIIKESGLSRILFIFKERFTKEEIDAYNLLRAVIFDPEVIRFTTVVRTGFPSFRIPEKCGEDKQKLINENQEIADIIKNKIIYVNNPPINTGDEDEERVNMNARLASRNFLLTHLNACGDEVYKPANLDDINERISGYMTESEQNAKMIEELTKTLEEEKDLSKKEREEMTKKLEQADIDRKQAVEKANGELMRALKENKEMFNQQTREQGENFNKILNSINEDKNELRELLKRREEELGKSRLEMEARGAEVQARIDQRERELQVVREELQRSRKEAKQNARKFNESDEKMRELERQIAQIEQKGECKLS